MADKAPSKDEMVDAMEEFDRMLTEARRLLAAWRLYRATGALHGRTPAELVETAKSMATTQYAYRRWVAEGAWTGYFKVASGVVHNCIACRTINDHTPVFGLPKLSGLSTEEVLAMGHTVCRHCQRLTDEDIAWKVGLLLVRLSGAVEEIVAEFGEAA